MHTTKIMILSNDHLTLETLHDMAGDRYNFAKGDGAYFVFVDPYAIQEPEEFGYPKDLIDCLTYAFKNGCTYIKFDRHEEYDPALPVYVC